VRQQLNLTVDQQRQLRRLTTDWQRQLNQLRRAAQSDPALTQQQFNSLQMQFQNQLGTILSPAQQQAWAQLVGQQFEFPANSFLQTDANRTQARLNRNIEGRDTQRARRAAPNAQPVR
jgi:hypothetical protein